MSTFNHYIDPLRKLLFNIAFLIKVSLIHNLMKVSQEQHCAYYIHHIIKSPSYPIEVTVYQYTH